MKKIVLFVFFIPLVCFSFAQETFPMEDEIYFEHIKSVKFHHSSLPTSYPIIDLKSSGKLKLSFDDLEGGNKDYVYSITHCDKDWYPSRIDEMEYLNGFNEEDITAFTFSSQTIHDYTHYELILPNNRTSLKVSGNYIITIMDEDRDNEIVLTKRFMVVEPMIIIESKVLPAFNAENYNTFQRVDFEIDLNKYYISDPQNELFVHILQNYRWDNAIKNIKPQNVLSERVSFNKFNTSSFPGGKEFRYFDTRDLQINSDRINTIDINRRNIDVVLKYDQIRENKTYIFERDGNGIFVPNYKRQARNGKTTSEYTDVTFFLESGFPIYGYDIYVVGEFSSWKLYPENKLEYYDDIKSYSGKLLLKQGYYNYYYAAINDQNEINFEITEGNWFETENEYTILVYYRQLGVRYDRLIGVSNINSIKDN